MVCAGFPVVSGMLACYLLPAVIVGITAGMLDGPYGDVPGHCFLTAEGGAIWAFVGPVLAVCVLNAVMFVRIVRVQ